MIVFLLFISPCLNSPGLAEQLESEAKEGGEAREPDTKTNLGISDFTSEKLLEKFDTKQQDPIGKTYFSMTKTV